MTKRPIAWTAAFTFAAALACTTDDGSDGPSGATDDDGGAETASPGDGADDAWVGTDGAGTTTADADDGSDGGSDDDDPGDSDDDSSGDDTTGGTPGEPGALQGYGTDSTFGEGGETCVVTSLAADGPGSLIDCATNRDTQDGAPTPRVVTFDVGGVIELQQQLVIRQPFLTIDASDAPEPGITIQQTGDGSTGGVIVSTWPPVGTCAHDVLLRGFRIRGTWTPDQGELGNNFPSLVVDGENIPGCIHHVVFDRMTVSEAVDSAGDIWGGATDITIQYSAFLNNYHPSTWSHFPGGEPGQARERLSAHHNLYANNHERNPQIRASVVDLNYEQNVVHNWDAHGFGGGYGIRIRCRNGACPERLNFIANHFTMASITPNEAIVLGEVVGADADENLIGPQLFMADNTLPPSNVDMGSAASEFARPAVAEVDLVPSEAVADEVLPWVGAPYRTAQEDAIFEEVAETLAAEQ